MAVVLVVAGPMLVFSTSGAALANPVGIQHIAVDIVDKEIWDRPDAQAAPVRQVIDGARTACGSLIGFRLYDTETKRGKPRPVRMCSKCAKTKPRETGGRIEVSVLGAYAVRGPDERTGQASLLS